MPMHLHRAPRQLFSLAKNACIYNVVCNV